VQLFDILLTLMDEKELRRDIRFGAGPVGGLDDGCFVFVLLDGEIPECNLVVGARGGED
jgi:hypothetical protein